MYLSSLILGVILTLAGAAAVAYGIPINEFEVGNMMIIAGTTAFSAGLILVSLAEVIRQLRRISESLMARPGLGIPHVEDLSEPVISSPRKTPASPRIPFPPKPEPRSYVPQPVTSPEPRLDIAPSLDTTGEPLDRPPPAFMRGMPEPRVIPERDETPLSPAEPRFTASREEKDELSEGLLATAFSRLDVSLRPAPPASEAPKQDEMFESMWPEPRKTSEPEPMQPSGETETPRFEAPMEEPPPEKSEEPYAVSILKSGVVDGMAYTLYSDGSIEAEMPQGTMRFASITELRAYLEKSSS